MPTVPKGTGPYRKGVQESGGGRVRVHGNGESLGEKKAEIDRKRGGLAESGVRGKIPLSTGSNESLPGRAGKRKS